MEILESVIWLASASLAGTDYNRIIMDKGRHERYQ